MRAHSGHVQGRRLLFRNYLCRRISYEWPGSTADTYLFGFEDREYSYSPTGFPTLVCANVVESEICRR